MRDPLFFRFFFLLGLGLFFLSLELLHLPSLRRSIHFAILSHWVRLLAVTLVIACSCKLVVLPTTPFGLLLATGAGGWFLFESMALWRSIHRFAMHCTPLFPAYTVLADENCWPNVPELRPAQNLLKNSGFTLECIARSDSTGPQLLICLVFRSTDDNSRLFLRLPCPAQPPALPSALVCSGTADGRMLLTENFAGVFAGYYPSNWDVVRRPLCQNLAALLALHGRRQRHCQLVPVGKDPMEQLNGMQRELYETNRSRAFFVCSQKDSRDCLSADAGFRIWMESLLLRYLGRPLA
ncbi:MAG: hypothetical protein LBP65_03600 [Puniceicoccales bacterium]|jgi:hypothetical protein|nr:hypothetical protein [Puniceicoccales bacterium]